MSKQTTRGWLLLAFAVGITLLGSAGCSPKATSPQPKTASELLQEETFWTLAFADAFGDGGSVSLSFIGSEGQIIHVWAQARRPSEEGPQRFYLKRTYNDPAEIVILPSSPLEVRVIDLLNKHQHRSDYTLSESLPKHFIALMRDRRRPFPRFDEWEKDPK